MNRRNIIYVTLFDILNSICLGLLMESLLGKAKMKDENETSQWVEVIIYVQFVIFHI